VLPPCSPQCRQVCTVGERRRSNNSDLDIIVRIFPPPSP
jgi:hypothetical protein